MNFMNMLTRREKVLIALLIALAIFWQDDMRLTQAAAPPHETIYTPTALYNLAKSSANRGEMVQAAAYLYAYIQRNPDAYDQNIGGHADKVDEVYDNWVDAIQSKLRDMDTINADLAHCDKFPCSGVSGVSGTSGTFRKVFPVDMIRVCANRNYGGKCSYLGIGEYDRWQELGVPNDTISSVEIGRDVEVLLCVHSLDNTDECMRFTGSDSDLSNNRVPGHDYYLNDNVSTARVTYKYGLGFTLP